MKSHFSRKVHNLGMDSEIVLVDKKKLLITPLLCCIFSSEKSCKFSSQGFFGARIHAHFCVGSSITKEKLSHCQSYGGGFKVEMWGPSHKVRSSHIRRHQCAKSKIHPDWGENGWSVITPSAKAKRDPLLNEKKWCALHCWLLRNWWENLASICHILDIATGSFSLKVSILNAKRTLQFSALRVPPLSSI